jgi:UDP-2-acetamido-3-amino-2,3-dideoxy-glucuronate N-acetyltransferase
MERNIAVVGCGHWGKNLVRNLAELGALHTICDANPKVLKQFASHYKDINTETEYQPVLQNQELKGVVIATPVTLHYSMAKEALLAGKDTFVEKPLALKVEEGKELGKIEYIYSNRLNLGKFRTEENILWSFAPHDISAILLLLNDKMPQEVSAQGGYYLHRDIADVTLTTLAFKDGIRAHIFVSWLHPYKEQRLVVVGDKKMALFDDVAPQDKLRLYKHQIEWVAGKPVPHPKEAEVVKVPLEEPLKLECQDFIRCIKTRRKPKADGRKGLQVLEILSLCQKSLEERGNVVKLSKGESGYFVHETSVVEEPSEIGEGTKVWHFAHIMPQVTIGKNCVIGQSVFIGKGVKIGNNVKIENNVSVFEGVTLEDDVFCGPSCVFTNVINPRSHIPRKKEFKPTLIKKGAAIGANATIVCGNTIGRYAFIGAGAVVTKDVPDHALVYGNPAQFEGWICQCGVRLQEAGNEARCPQCGKVYRLKGQKCSLLPEAKEDENPPS